MEKIIIFGLGDNAELAKYYFEIDSQYIVYGFTVDKEFKDKEKFCGLPVLEWEKVGFEYKPDKFMLFIATGYGDMNRFREKKYLEGKKRGFKFANYLSSKASIFTDMIGENNFILENNTIQPYVKIGNNNVFWSGNHIGHHGSIGDNNFITSQVTVAGRVNIKNNCFLGINATIRDHIIINSFTLIGAGAWISKNTEEYEVYTIPPSKKIDKKSIDLKI